MNASRTPTHDPETVILLPGGSAARLLRGQLIGQTAGSGSTVFEAPRVIAISAWLKQMWQQIPVCAGIARPVLLTGSQERAIWQDIIRESDWSDVLMQPGLLARSAAQAYRLMVDWNINPGQLQSYSLDESQALREWCATFDRRTRENRWLPECRLPDFLLGLEAGVLEWPSRIRLAGMEELPPAQRTFFATLESRGCRVDPYEPEQRNRIKARAEAGSLEQECRGAAAWVADRLSANPVASIAVALADQRQAADLRRALDRALNGDLLHRSHRDASYNDAGGRRMDAEPMIAVALRILGQSHHRADFNELSRILRSTYIAAADVEMLERARLDASLRKLGELRPSLGFVAGQIVDRESGEPRFDCPALHKRLHDWRRAIDGLPKSQAPSEWADSFSVLLAALGWPGSGNGDIELMNRWNDVLSELCALDAVTGKLDLDSALTWLRRIAAETTSPVRSANARVHIIGIDDAARVGFDHLWIAGLDDDRWPPSTQPNPLLPVTLQRDAGIPAASSDARLRRAQQLLDRAVAGSTEAVCSNSMLEGDRELRPSPLIASIEVVSLDSLVTANASIIERLFEARAGETIEDQTRPLATERARGGTSILKNQAACPFRAFVDSRLAAAIPEEPEPGLDASERGTLLHQVLETVWNALGSHERLVNTGEAERQRLVTEAARTALQQMAWKKPETITAKFLELELERLVTRVMAWLQFEQQRDRFTVLTPEAERRIELAGLQLKMRIDRIDETATGERVILDYKTGQVRVSSWFDERPDEPQLPLYALAEVGSGHPVAAISFAQLRPNDLSFKGISNADGVLPGVKSVEKHRDTREQGDWQALLDQWRERLEGLAKEFVEGVATVDPKSTGSCRYCEFDAVCRINELRQRAGLVAVDESDDGDDHG